MFVTAATLTVHGNPIESKLSFENGVTESHRLLMSRGELIFHLRNIHRYWSTPRISERDMEELEQQNLIQRSPNDICAIRLTEEGARVKNWQPTKRL
jgi:hypothetical protein